MEMKYDLTRLEGGIMGKQFGILCTIFLIVLSLGACSNSDDGDATLQNTTTNQPFQPSQTSPVIGAPPTTSMCPGNDQGCCSSHGGFDPLNCCLNGTILCRDGTLSPSCRC